MALADELSDVAEVIAEFGKTVVYSHSGGDAVYDVETSSYVSPPPQTKTLKVILEDFNQPVWNGGDVASGDKKFTFLASQLGFAPKIGGVFKLDGISYTVPDRGVKVTYIGETPFLYEVRAGF